MDNAQKLLTRDELQYMMDTSVSQATDNTKSEMKAILSDWTEKFKTASYSVDGGQVKPAEVKPAAPVAEMEDAGGALAGISKFDIAGIPVGTALVGGFGAVFVTELVDGFMATQSATTRGMVKLGSAVVIGKYGKKFLGDGVSKAIGLLITFDALRDIVPLDTYAQQLASKISGLTTTAGLAGNNKTMRTMSAPEAQNYYSKAGL